MGLRYAVANGNWSNVATWDGGVSLPAVGDHVRANGFTVIVDGSYTVLNVGNYNESAPAVAGGQFQLANGAVLTCTDATSGTRAGATPACVRFILGAGNSATFVGVVTGPWTGLAGTGMEHAGAGGTLNVVGAVSTGLGNSGNGFTVTAAGAIWNVVGKVAPSVSGTSNAITVTAASAVGTITGNISCAPNAGYNPVSVYLSGLNSVTTINGNVEGSNFSTNSNAVVMGSSALSLVVYGTITAKLWTGVFGASTSFSCYFSGPFVNSLAGCPAFIVYKWFWAPVLSPTYHSVPINTGLSHRTMYTADYASAFDQPAVGNVRSGTTYGIGGALTGTLAVPPPGAVGLGVPTDNTVGTAVWTQEALAAVMAEVAAAFGV